MTRRPTQLHYISVALSILFLVLVNQLWAQKPEVAVQTGHSSGVNSVALSPDGQMLASGSWDKTIKLWEVAERAPASSH